MKTKAEELAILREAARQLGPDTYTGAWLSEQISQIESDIRADYLPTVSYRIAQHRAACIIEEAKGQAADIIRHATEQAEQRRKADLARTENLMGRIRGALADCERAIGFV